MIYESVGYTPGTRGSHCLATVSTVIRKYGVLTVVRQSRGSSYQQAWTAIILRKRRKQLTNPVLVARQVARLTCVILYIDLPIKKNAVTPEM